MSDEGGQVLFNPAGGGEGQGKPEPSQDGTSSQSETTGAEGQPKYITEDALNKRLEDFERRVQSSRDSALSTFDKRIKVKIENVERDIAKWREQGVNITPEQEQKRRMDALQEALLENPDADSPSSSRTEARQGAPSEEVVKEVNARAYQLAQQAGVELAEGDPELLLLDQSTPESFLASFRNALYQKKLRAGDNAQPPEARITTMGTATKPAPGDADQFLKEYKAAKGKGLSVAREIRQKWMRKGLDVNAIIDENF